MRYTSCESIKLVSKASDSTIEWMGRNMRDLDAEGIEMATGLDPETILRISIKSSDFCRWAFHEEEKIPLCVFGVSGMSGTPGVGVPWMMGSDYLFKYPLQILKLSTAYLAVMQSRYEKLENYVYAKDEKSVKFLEHIGFTVEVPYPWGIEGKLYQYFYWDRIRSEFDV